MFQRLESFFLHYKLAGLTVFAARSMEYALRGCQVQNPGWPDNICIPHVAASKHAPN